MEGVLVMENVSAKLFRFFNGGSIGDEERACQPLQLHKWRVYWWSRTCLSNSLAPSMEGVLVIKNVSVEFYSFFNWREYWWSRTCLPNYAVSSMEGVLVMKNVSAKLFRFFNGGSIGDEERACQPLQLHKWRVYWWSRTCLSNSLAPSMEGVLVIEDVSVKLFSFNKGWSIGDEERACQTLLLIYWREYWWSRTDLSNSSISSTEGLFVTRNVSVKLFSFFNGGRIGNQECVCQTL